VLALLLRRNGNSERLHSPAAAGHDACNVNRETGIISGNDQVSNELWNIFEVNRGRLIYNLESQQAAALGHISYRNIARVQTLYFLI